MAARRKRGPRLGGVLRAVGRLVLLIGFGFGVGLVVGLVSEEPALVYGHLTGKGETVPLVDSATEAPPIIEAPVALTNEPGAPPGDTSGAARRGSPAPALADPAKRVAARDGSDATAKLPDVAAPPPVPAPTRPPAAGVDVAASKPAAAVTDQARWSIQVGAFSEEATARRLVKTLEAKSYPVAVLPSNGSNKRWRVRVQPLRGEEHARGIANQLKQEEGLPVWLIPMEAGSR